MKQKHTDIQKHTIPAVSKALELVRVLAEGNTETTTKGLAYRLGIPRTTCYRILRSLVAKDWVRPVEGGEHVMSLGLLFLLEALRQAEHLVDAVQPALEMLAMRSHLAAKVSVRQGDYAVTVARAESPNDTSVAVRVGASFHLVYGSSGTVLLSGMSEEEVKDLMDCAPEGSWEHQKSEDVAQRIKVLRSRGWCSDIGSFSPSVHAISAPLHDTQGKVLAAMTLVGFAHELPQAKIPEVAKMLLESARQAEKEIRKRAPGRQSTKPTTKR